MNSVYLLWHTYEHDDPGRDADEILIGVYRTEDAAKAAIKRLSGKPGFVDRPEGFQICPYELDKDHWTEGFIFD